MSISNIKYIFAIDLGTSGPKVALVSIHGNVLDHEFEKTDTILIANNGVEEDPKDWWQATVTAAKRLLSKKLVPINDIIAISCTSQWSGTVAVDKNGNHLMNAITWMDARGAKHVQKITNGLIKLEGYGILKLYKWITLTGGVPLRSGKDPIAHILFIKNILPDIYKKTYKFLEPKDYLNLKLTGNFFASNESITLHWVTDNRDINNIHYNDDLIKMAGIEKEKLPELKQATDIIGPVKKDIARELGLKESTCVIMGTPDIHSAAIGSGAIDDFAGHLYVGTSGWLLCHLPYKKTDLFHNMGALPSAIPGKYLLINEQDIAGESLNFLRDNIIYPDDELTPETKIKDVHEAFNTMAKKIPPGCDNLIFTPWLNGERSPVDDSSIRAGFNNMSLNTTRSHMVRAVFEGVAFNAKWLLKYVEKLIKKKMNHINIIGGGAKSDLWCQIHADIMNRTIRRVKDPILANVRGAGLLGSVALGFITFDEINKKTEYDGIFKPNPENRKLYKKMFKQYQAIYKHNKKIHKRLNR
jgi:xylulokinase